MSAAIDSQIRGSVAGRPATELPALWAPIILVDAAAKVLATNEAGRSWLEQSSSLSRSEDCLLARTQDETIHLHRSIATVAQAADGSRQLVLSQDAAEATVAVYLMPWGRLNVLALIQQPEPKPVNRFGLTAAEAALAGDMVAGLRSKDIARKRNRSIATVRSQLASVMRKTGTTRQADLIRMLLRP